MTRARFHVFSGTGNSLHLARSLAARFRASGARTEIIEVSSETLRHLRSASPASSAPPVGDTLDLFLFPVYALSVPRIMVRYIAALGPRKSGVRPRAAVLSTNGRVSASFRDGHEGQALAQAESLLARRGWDVSYRETFDYPQSITSFLNPHDEDRKAALLAALEPVIDRAAGDLLGGIRFKRPCRPVFHLIGWPFGWLFRLFGRRCWAMLFAADGRCDGCGVCARRCPAGAIRMSGGRPAWSYACEGCDRCINLCPKAAIQTSALRISLVALIMATVDACPLKPAASGAFFGAAGTSALSGAAFGALWFAVSTILGFALLRAADAALVGLGRVPALRPILAFGWTRWFRRYRAPR